MVGPDDLAAARQFIETEAEREGVPADPTLDCPTVRSANRCPLRRGIATHSASGLGTGPLG